MSKRRFNPSSEEDAIPIVEKIYRENQPNFHSAGGFLDDDDEFEERREQIAEARQKKADAAASSVTAPDDCETCAKPLLESFLWERFSQPVCDTCRDTEGEHKLLARTEVKRDYLLRDCDLDERKPALRYWAKKNPHNPRYGDMKLYLKCQVVARTLEVHGSWEGLEDAKRLKESQKEVRNEKTFQRKVKEMRTHIRGLKAGKVTVKDGHEHEYDEEVYDEKADNYKKTCTLCGFVLTYEKL